MSPAEAKVARAVLRGYNIEQLAKLRLGKPLPIPQSDDALETMMSVDAIRFAIGLEDPIDLTRRFQLLLTGSGLNGPIYTREQAEEMHNLHICNYGPRSKGL